MFKTTILLLLIASSVFGLCDFNDTIDITNGQNNDGMISYGGLIFDESEYFFDNDTKTVRGCITLNTTHINKCCPHGEGYNDDTLTCDVVTEEFHPIVLGKNQTVQEKRIMDLLSFDFGKPACRREDNKVRISVGQVADVLNIGMDGKLYVEIPTNISPWMAFTPDNYCIDTFVSEEKGQRTTKLSALACFDQKPNNINYIPSITCMLTSCVFILATVAVYCWLPELCNLHGKVLIAYLLSLFVGFLFLSTMQILLVIDNITQECCLVFTFIIYYSLLAAFFWLNVMCFDIWWTFSGNRGMSIERMSVKTRFRAYSLYAFGVPTLLTILVAALEFSDLPPHPLLPLLQQLGCFISGTSRLLYLYGPMVILCIANMVFFILTAIKIKKIKEQTAVLKSKESATHDKHNNDKQRLFLYVKLFIVMGINWLLEVISALYPEADKLWNITDAYNVLVGLIIFILFVCKRKIFRLLKKRIKERFHRSNTEFRNTTRTNGSRSNFHTENKQRSSSESIRMSNGADNINTTNV